MNALDEVGSAGLGWVAYDAWHGLANGKFVRIEADTGNLTLPASPQLNEMRLGHSLWVIAPVLPSGWVFLGEQNKLVAASRRRVKSWSVNASSHDLELSLVAAPNEKLELSVLPPGPSEQITKIYSFQQLYSLFLDFSIVSN